MKLSELHKDTVATVVAVEDQMTGDTIARRLRELGFVEGERVVVRAMGPFGGDPMMVHIGDSRFAVRRTEAARVKVEVAA